MGKRYYWLKLYDDFFDSKRIKKLRKMAGGDTYTIIYLKMQLLAMKHNGVIEWSGLEDSFAAELALDLDEQEEDIQVVLAFLISCGLAETSDNIHFFLPYAVENTGSEGSSAERMRNLRTRQASQCDTLPSQCDKSVTERREEKEIDTIVRDREREEAPAKSSKRFVKPTIAEIQQCINENNLQVDAQRFFNYYESNGWKVGRNPMKDWVCTLKNWSRNNTNNSQSYSYSAPPKKVEQDGLASSFATDDFMAKALAEVYGGILNE